MLHSHTQFCDGHADMAEMAAAAYAAGMRRYGFSPHSPIPIASPCNMKREDVEAYMREGRRLRELYAGKMEILIGMEVDFLGADWGPHIPYFHELGLDYRIGSVHFVPNRKGEFIDCDGSDERFARYLQDHFGGDLDYVTHKYFDQVEEMVERGGFEILGHLDKIARNAASVRSGVEDEPWWAESVERIIKRAVAKGITIEINTKAYGDCSRFFPAERWWPLLKQHGAKVIFNSDAHWPRRVESGLAEGKTRFHALLQS